MNKPTVNEALNAIIWVIIGVTIGIMLIYQGMPQNNRCRIIESHRLDQVTDLEIIQCYPDTKDYYFN